MVPFPLFLALKYLRPKRSFISVVTFISVLGVLLGVAILIIVLSVMTGFGEVWRDKILSFKPHITVTSSSGVIEGEDELCQEIEKIEGVKGVTPAIETLVMIRHEGAVRAPVLLGVSPERAGSVSMIPSKIRFGSFSVEGEQVVLGYDLAFEMGVRVGSKLLIYSPRNVTAKDEMYVPLELTVSGIFDMGMRDFDSGVMIASLDVARELVGLDRGSQVIYVMTKDPFNVDEYASKVRGEIGTEYTVRTWRDVDIVLFKALTHEKIMMCVLLVFITIVAIFCVANTLIVITVQKTNEIGLLKALGFSSGQIMGAFVWHGWIQCITGTLLGIGVGYLVLYNLHNIVSFLALFHVTVFPKEIYGLDEIPWSKLSFREVGGIAALVIFFCTLASFLPARRASHMDPVEALRKE